MSDKQAIVKEACSALSLSYTRENLETLLQEAEEQGLSYLEFLFRVTNGEQQARITRAAEKRTKEAGFPYHKSLDNFDLDFCQALSRRQFNQLREYTWVDALYNLIFSGPPGVGKTHLAIGLGCEACSKGYKVSYTTMQSLIKTMKTEEINKRSRRKMQLIRASHLLIIDEVGYVKLSDNDGNNFFQLISEIQEQASVLITTNKGFEQWTEFLDDPALATAVLDRLTFHCDTIQMSGKSYRLENRKSFLD